MRRHALSLPRDARAARQLRVAHVLSSLGMGGQERIALDLAAGQSLAGHRVVVISLAPSAGGPLAEEFRARGIEVQHVPKRRRVDLAVAAELGAFVRRRRLHVVHTHNPLPLLYAAPPARAVGAAVVHTKHGMNPAPARQVWLRRASAALTDAFVAVSEHTAEVAREARECPKRRLRVIPNGIDVSRFSADVAARLAVRAELGVPAGAQLVGTVGRLFAEKGHELLLRAVGPLLSERFHLVIIGDGPEAATLAERARALSHRSSVHLLGPRHDVPRLLAALDVFALTSIREGLPLVVPEAMAAELPVVATAVGGLPRVVEHGVTGYLIESGDERALRARLAELAAAPGLARRLGARGRERALAEFSSEAMLARYMEVYREALARR